MQRKRTLEYVLAKKYDGMMGRCYREKDPSFKTYGAKGIKVAYDWIVDINNFRSWAIKQLEAQQIPQSYFVENSAKIQLDRIDPNKHYTPENCRFSTVQENARNKILLRGKTIISAEGTVITFGV